MKFKQRIDRLSRSIDELQFAQGGIRVCFQEHGQTKEEAMAVAGIDPEDNALTVIVVKWASGHEPGYPLYNHLVAEKAAENQKTVAEIDSELQQLRSELNKETQQ